MENKEVLTIEWSFDDYLAVTDRDYCEDSKERWAKIIDKIDLEKYGCIDLHERVRNTIELLDEELADD